MTICQNPQTESGGWIPGLWPGIAAAAVVAFALAAPVPTIASSSPAEVRSAIDCHDRPVTMVGSSGPDVLTGTPGRDVIWAGRGNDVVRSRGGNDFICAGPGDDDVGSGRGDDTVWAGQGSDHVMDTRGSRFAFSVTAFGGDGADVLRSSVGFPDLSGGRGADVLRAGGTSSGILRGGLGTDTLIGSDREHAIGDSLKGGPGRDLVRARGGIDEILGVPGDGDRVFGGSGRDTLLYWLQRTPVRASLALHRVARIDGTGLVDRVFGVEDVAGSEAADVLIGSGGPNTLVGQGGADRILGRGGTDLLLGDGGGDLLNGGGPGDGSPTDPDLLFGRAGFDTCINGNAFGRTSDDEPSCEATDVPWSAGSFAGGAEYCALFAFLSEEVSPGFDVVEDLGPAYAVIATLVVLVLGTYLTGRRLRAFNLTGDE